MNVIAEFTPMSVIVKAPPRVMPPVASSRGMPPYRAAPPPSSDDICLSDEEPPSFALIPSSSGIKVALWTILSSTRANSVLFKMEISRKKSNLSASTAANSKQRVDISAAKPKSPKKNPNLQRTKPCLLFSQKVLHLAPSVISMF